MQCSPVAYGIHTLWTVWIYQAGQAGLDLTLIMQQLNHNSIAYAKRYLDITGDEIGDVVRRLNL